MKCSLLALAIFLSWNSPATAQQPNMEQWLNIGTDQERVQKMISLGVEREAAEIAGDEVKWRPVRTQTHQDLAILFLPCGALYGASLYLLHNTDHGWHVVDSIGFDCHYDNSVSFEVAPLRNPSVDDVLVHHECEEHGTGFVHQNFNVFAISSSKFKLVLDTEEILQVSGWPKADELDQRSSFATIPAKGALPGGIEETRCSKRNGTLTIQRRKFRWSESSFRFLHSHFVRIDPAEEKSSPACS